MVAKRIDPLVVIVGETASGKSALAIDLAEKFDGELICADSLTVRREVNIGSAKPSFADRKRIRHHLIDVTPACSDFTAADFKSLADKAIKSIHEQGKLPIMVGGTGLYIDAVIYNYGFLPRGNRADRQALNELSINALLTMIKQRNIPLGSVDIRNKRRLIRLIETDGAIPDRSNLRPNTLILGIELTRDELAKRITERVNTMLRQGLQQEVRELSQKYGWECESLKGIGYREWHKYFLGSQTLDQTRQRIVKSSLDLAKKQRTWFRRNKSIHWLDEQSKAVDLITTFLNK